MAFFSIDCPIHLATAVQQPAVFCLFSSQALAAVFRTAAKERACMASSRASRGHKVRTKHSLYICHRQCFRSCGIVKMEETYRKRKPYEPPLFKRSLSRQLFRRLQRKNPAIRIWLPWKSKHHFLSWFTHHPFFIIIVRVCHHQKGTTIKTTGNDFQGLQTIASSGLIVITHPKFNKKSP